MIQAVFYLLDTIHFHFLENLVNLYYHLLRKQRVLFLKQIQVFLFVLVNKKILVHLKQLLNLCKNYMILLVKQYQKKVLQKNKEHQEHQEKQVNQVKLVNQDKLVN